MAPNQKSTEDEGQILESPEPGDSKRLEIHYDGFYYDVTDFIKKHPGGNVIKFYTEKGEDATLAAQQFHFRSMKKFNLLLKGLKKRPATDEDFGMNPEKLKRHRALTEDYTKLFVEIQKEGLFEPSYSHTILRIVHMLSIGLAGVYLLQSDSVLTQYLGAFLIAICAGHAGYTLHEGGHNSLTGSPKIDRFLASALYGSINGLPAGFWKRMHNRHHAMPQRMHHDVDLHTTPLLAFNANVVKDAKEGNSFFIQNQAWLFLSIDNFLVVHFWRLYLGPKTAIILGNYLDLFFCACNWIILYNLFTFPQYCFAVWATANYLLGNFTLAHTHLPIAEDNTHWVEYSISHTSDIHPHPLTDWWMGYLNYQIEHHLFPTMPQFRNHLVVDRVKALAAKHGIPYRCYGFWEAWGISIRNLKGVSNQLKSKQSL